MTAFFFEAVCLAVATALPLVRAGVSAGWQKTWPWRRCRSIGVQYRAAIHRRGGIDVPRAFKLATVPFGASVTLSGSGPFSAQRPIPNLGI